MEDEKLIGLFFERSEQAIAGLSDKYGGLCMKLAGDILPDRQDAEECVNDAYLGVWNTIPPQRPEKLLSYVLRIVRNLALKKHRYNTAAKRSSNLTEALDELEPFIPSGTDTESEYDASAAGEAINSFLGGLKKEDRILFVRRYWFSQPIDELAELFGTSSHNISVRLHRTREKLKKHLEKEGVYL
ncbi:MAG: sigma-70 family RNA polymerase sigma factor [Ruminococcus sp.]|nr:sigma-70 family RNA polymerase sigma factor [Ruminococcus sp.]